MGALTVADLVPGDAEPRIKDLVLAERLGFGKPKAIRETIRQRRGELECCGVLPTLSAKPLPGSKGGRPETYYLLNEMQAALVCMWSRTPAAQAIRNEMASVFMAYRRGELVPAGGISPYRAAKFLPSGLSENQAAKARGRLAVLKRVAQLEDGGMVRTHAVNQAAIEHGVSRATIYNWFQRFNAAGERPALVALAPQWNGGGHSAEIPDSIWVIFLGAQLQRQNAAASYRLARAAADAAGQDIPHCKTFLRRFQQIAAAALKSSLEEDGE